MKKNTLIVLFFLLVINACNNTECVKAKIDSSIKELEEYNANFFDKNYTGTVIDYYNEKDSLVKSIIFYEKGKIIKTESYYENSSPKVIRHVKCQSTNGVMKYYLTNHKLAYDLEYNLGKKEGIGHSYFESGTVQKIVNYKNDLKDGRQLELNEREDTIVIEVYKMGNLLSKLEIDKELEKIRSQGSDSFDMKRYFELMSLKRNNIPSKELQELLDNARTVEEY